MPIKDIITSLKSSNHEEAKYRSCYWVGGHVRQTATIIAIITLVLNIITLILSAIIGFWSVFISSILNVIVSLFVIYADKHEKPWAYSPFIILVGLGTINYFISSIVLFVQAGQWGRINQGIYVALGIICIIESFVYIWCVWVVIMAYNYMQDLVVSGRSAQHEMRSSQSTSANFSSPNQAEANGTPKV